jgi:hypothetical protein
MKAVHSVPNLAWLVLIGGFIQEINYRRFWPTKKLLKHDLAVCGLKLGAGNKIEVA